MARNKVQFQEGLSEAQFASLYGTEDQCREAVMRWRWPSGFVCPVCGGKDHSLVKTRAPYQCTARRRQTSLIAGTIFAATKVPLGTWFRAMYHLTQSKGRISSIELGRRLGVTQTTAWKIKHKLMQVMMERDAAKRLTGRIEVDDAYRPSCFALIVLYANAVAAEMTSICGICEGSVVRSSLIAVGEVLLGRSVHDGG